MKTIEEKAKAYDEAIKRGLDYIRHTPATEMVTRQDIFEAIFPELAESEEEKIKKFIKEQLYKIRSTAVNNSNLDIKLVNAIDWLEKQGESDETKAKIFLINKGYPIDANGVFPTYEEMFNIIREGFEKQGEQKPFDYEHVNIQQKDFAPKIKPKFKVGDWCIDNEDATIFQIVTIEDAKDGDVLAFDNDTIAIFKDLYNATSFHSYCCYVEDGVFNISRDDMPEWWVAKGFHPATKEQRDVFFSKMKEEGYEWDAEKKEIN